MEKVGAVHSVNEEPGQATGSERDGECFSICSCWRYQRRFQPERIGPGKKGKSMMHENENTPLKEQRP